MLRSWTRRFVACSMKYEMGLFEDPYRNLSRLPPEPIERRLQRAAARDVARRTLVLLKNRQHTLPLSKHGRIALVGPLANSRRDLLRELLWRLRSTKSEHP